MNQFSKYASLRRRSGRATLPRSFPFPEKLPSARLEPRPTLGWVSRCVSAGPRFGRATLLRSLSFPEKPSPARLEPRPTVRL